MIVHGFFFMEALPFPIIFLFYDIFTTIDIMPFVYQIYHQKKKNKSPTPEKITSRNQPQQRNIKRLRSLWLRILPVRWTTPTQIIFLSSLPSQRRFLNLTYNHIGLGIDERSVLVGFNNIFDAKQVLTAWTLMRPINDPDFGLGSCTILAIVFRQNNWEIFSGKFFYSLRVYCITNLI